MIFFYIVHNLTIKAKIDTYNLCVLIILERNIIYNTKIIFQKYIKIKKKTYRQCKH